MRTIWGLLLLAGIGGGLYFFLRKDGQPSSSGGAIEFWNNAMTGSTRGIRNNNPGNIVWNSVNNWLGQTGLDDKGFAVFNKPENGIRAMNKLLNTYATTGRNTARKIVESWTMGDPSATQSNYMLKIEQLTGKNRDAVLGDSDRLALIKAIILFENANNNPYSDVMIMQSMALP